MPNIKLDGVEISEDKLREIIKAHPELVEEKSGRFVPEYGKNYWCVSDVAAVLKPIWVNDVCDKFRLSQGNVFRTREEAEKHLEYLNALAVIKEDAQWWIPDWSDDSQEKWYGYYYHNDYTIKIGGVYSSQYSQEIYFQTKELLEQSLKNHRKEWEIIMGIN